VAAAAGNQEAAERLKSRNRERVMPEARLLLDKVDGRTLVEVLAPEYSHALARLHVAGGCGGRADAVRLHGLLGSAWAKEPYLGGFSAPSTRTAAT
jgi:hypothetical protein